MKTKHNRHSQKSTAILLIATLSTPGCFLIPDAPEGDTDGEEGSSDASSGDGESGNGESGNGEPENGEPAGADPFLHTAYIAQTREYDGLNGLGQPEYSIQAGCQSTDVDPDGQELAVQMLLDGWDVRFARDPFLNPDASLQFHPGHFAEAHAGPPFTEFGVVGAADEANADGYDLAVYSGHGSPGEMNPNVAYDEFGCSVMLETDVRLGKYCGRFAKVAIYSASCVASVDEALCPLPEEGPNGELGEWPAYCWLPWDCSIFRSRANHTLAFVDSPVVSAPELVDWYSRAKNGNPLVLSWILELAFDDEQGVPNQPAGLVIGNTAEEAWSRLYGSDINSGTFLDAIAPSTIVEESSLGTWLQWDGQTGLYDDNGDLIQLDAQQSETNWVCAAGHDEECVAGIELPNAEECMSNET